MKPLILLLLLTTGCMVNGVRMDNIKEPRKVATGFATSFIVHWLGHVLYLESNGIEWRQEGYKEVAKEDLTYKQAREFGRSGFALELLGGLILKNSPYGASEFATGYYMGSAAEIILYPIGDNSDFELIGDGGGDKSLEYGLYSIYSLMLLEEAKNHTHSHCQNQKHLQQPQR